MDSKQSGESVGTVAIVGRPNVGKSALFNRLVGRNIAIVHDQPGITRDRLAALSSRGRRPFSVWDTGGIGGAGETELTTQVRTAADAAMRESDVILFVVDAQAGLNPIDQELAKLLRKSKRPVVLVVNKMDHEKHDDLDVGFRTARFRAVHRVSAPRTAAASMISSKPSIAFCRLPQSKIGNRKSEIPRSRSPLSVVPTRANRR